MNGEAVHVCTPRLVHAGDARRDAPRRQGVYTYAVTPTDELRENVFVLLSREFFFPAVRDFHFACLVRACVRK